MTLLTYDDATLICICGDTMDGAYTRKDVMRLLSEALRRIRGDEEALKVLISEALSRLRRMSDAEFAALRKEGG